jgi:hypothetical protein
MLVRSVRALLKEVPGNHRIRVSCRESLEVQFMLLKSDIRAVQSPVLLSIPEQVPRAIRVAANVGTCLSPWSELSTMLFLVSSIEEHMGCASPDF